MFAKTISLSCAKTFNVASRTVANVIPDTTVPIITIPVKHNRMFVKKHLTKKQQKGKVLVLAKPGKLLVSCSDRKYNMYTNEFPTKFEPPALASEHWTGHKSPGKHFTIMPTRDNPSILNDQEISVLQLHQKINESLRQLNYTCPTKVQTQAIPVIMDGYNTLYVAETGSGKTYTYLLPIIHSLLSPQHEERIHRPQFPSCVVLVPTKELSFQVQQFIKEEHVDIIVSTPVKLLQTLKKRQLDLNDVTKFVVDECDTLLDASFSDITLSILNRLNILKGKSQPMNVSHETQLILCSATFPEYAENALSDVISFDDVATVQTGYTHRIQPHVQHKFIRVKPSEKFTLLLHIINSQIKLEKTLTMIFCNNISTCILLTEMLTEQEMKVVNIHKQLNMEERKYSMEQFYSGKADLLVTTDLSSRGVNTTKVEHVINYDFPNAVSDYIHRSGRCGRVDQATQGRITNLISRKWEVPRVNQIEEAARKRDRVEGINANIKQFLKLRKDHIKLMKQKT